MKIKKIFAFTQKDSGSDKKGRVWGKVARFLFYFQLLDALNPGTVLGIDAAYAHNKGVDGSLTPANKGKHISPLLISDPAGKGEGEGYSLYKGAEADVLHISKDAKLEAFHEGKTEGGFKNILPITDAKKVYADGAKAMIFADKEIGAGQDVKKSSGSVETLVNAMAADAKIFLKNYGVEEGVAGKIAQGLSAEGNSFLFNLVVNPQNQQDAGAGFTVYNYKYSSEMDKENFISIVGGVVGALEALKIFLNTKYGVNFTYNWQKNSELSSSIYTTVQSAQVREALEGRGGLQENEFLKQDGTQIAKGRTVSEIAAELGVDKVEETETGFRIFQEARTVSSRQMKDAQEKLLQLREQVVAMGYECSQVQSEASGGKINYYIIFNEKGKAPAAKEEEKIVPKETLEIVKKEIEPPEKEKKTQQTGKTDKKTNKEEKKDIAQAEEEAKNKIVQQTEKEKQEEKEINKTEQQKKKYPKIGKYKEPVAGDLFIESEYKRQFGRLRFLLEETLPMYSNFDNLRALAETAQEAKKSYNTLLELIGRAPAGEREVWRQQLAQDMLSLQGRMPFGLEHVINSAGKMDSETLTSSINSIIRAVEDINALDAKINELMLLPPGQAEDKKEEARQLLNTLRANEGAAQFILLQRYGINGEGLSVVRDVMNFGESSAIASEQYFDIVNELIENEGTRQNLFGQWTRFEARYPESAKTLMSATKNDVITSKGIGSRAIYDFVSRISILGVGDELPSTLGDEQLNLILNGALSEMPVGMQYLLLSNIEFHKFVSRIGDNDAQVGIFNNATTLISSMYAATEWQYRHEKCTELANMFAQISMQGNLVTHMQDKNYYGLERGEIRQKVPWDFERLQYLFYPVSSLSTFAQSMPTPVTPFSIQIIPRIYERQNLQQPYGAHYSFDRAVWDWYTKYINLMPSSQMQQIRYGENWIGMQIDSKNIMAAMSEAYQQLLISAEYKFDMVSGGAYLQGGNRGMEDSPGGRGLGVDAQAHAQGRRHGRSARAEVLYEEKTQMESEYDVGKYRTYETEMRDKEFAQLQGTNVQLFGTHIFDGIATLRSSGQSGIEGQSGEITKVGGIEDEQRWYSFTSRLHSTFPGAKEGTTIAIINASGEKDRPYETNTGGEQTEHDRYYVNVFTKRGDTWVHEISEEDSRKLLQMDAGNGETLEDMIAHHFGQIYTEQNKFIGTAAAEHLESKYQINEGPLEGNRLGMMLIAQPWGDWAAGGANTVTGDASAIAALKKGNYVFDAGYKIYDEKSLPTIAPFSTYANTRYNYRRQGYTVGTGLPEISDEKTHVVTASMMLIDEYKASVFGGWKSTEEDILAGGDVRSKSAHASSFFHFDNNGYLSNCVISVGGKTKSLDLGVGKIENVNLIANAIRGRGQGEGAYGEEIVAGTTFDVGNGKMSIFTRISEKPYLTNPWSNYTNKMIVDAGSKLSKSIANISPETILNIKTHDSEYRKFMVSAQNLASQIVYSDPTNALYSNTIASVSVGYKSENTDWVFSNQFLRDGGTLASGMMNFSDRVAFIGATSLKATNEDANMADAYRYILGTKIKPTDASAMHAFVGYMGNEKLAATLGAGVEDIIGTSLTVGGKKYESWEVENYLLHLTVGPQKYMGIMNIGGIRGMGSAGMEEKFRFSEISGRVMLSAGFYLLAGYRNIQVLSNWEDVNAQNPLLQTVKQYGMSPEKFEIDQGIFSLKYKYGDAVFDFTGQINNVRGRDSPVDFYIGGGVTIYR